MGGEIAVLRLTIVYFLLSSYRLYSYVDIRYILLLPLVVLFCDGPSAKEDPAYGISFCIRQQDSV